MRDVVIQLYGNGVKMSVQNFSKHEDEGVTVMVVVVVRERTMVVLDSLKARIRVLTEGSCSKDGGNIPSILSDGLDWE